MIITKEMSWGYMGANANKREASRSVEGSLFEPKEIAMPSILQEGKKNL